MNPSSPGLAKDHILLDFCCAPLPHCILNPHIFSQNFSIVLLVGLLHFWSEPVLKTNLYRKSLEKVSTEKIWEPDLQRIWYWKMSRNWSRNFRFFSHTWKSFQFPKITLLKVKRRCFEVTLRKFQVQIGAQGTDDDVRVKVCCLSPFCHLDSCFP